MGVRWTLCGFERKRIDDGLSMSRKLELIV
jgi:hypothetical protein